MQAGTARRQNCVGERLMVFDMGTGRNLDQLSASGDVPELVQLQGDEISFWDRVLFEALRGDRIIHDARPIRQPRDLTDAILIADQAVIWRRTRLPKPEPASGGGPYREEKRV